MVLAGALLGVLIVVYSCNASGKTSPASAPSATPAAPTKAAASPSPTAQATVTQAAVVSPTATVAVATGDLCTDAEISVKAVPAKTTMAAGTEIQITLVVKNISNRTCSRDVGADQQELRVVFGADKIWSSDDCDGPTGTDVRNFPPNHERSYNAIWNGESSTSCSTTTKRTPNGPAPIPGEYQLIGRVGTDLSDPIVLKIT
jgi:hypothetical protein